LSKRFSTLYDNWSCLFCNAAQETLQNFITCPNLAQTWTIINSLVYTHLQQILLKFKIRHVLSPILAEFLSPITDFSTIDYLPPSKYLAVSIFLAYILADLHNMDIRQNFKKLEVSMFKHVLVAFGTNIWIPRCTLNAKREKRLNIT